MMNRHETERRMSVGSYSENTRQNFITDLFSGRVAQLCQHYAAIAQTIIHTA
jgi:hypothetical protein